MMHIEQVSDYKVEIVKFSSDFGWKIIECKISILLLNTN